MARVSSLQNAFNGGKVTPLIDAREDIEPYNRSCRELKNAIASTQGPAFKRKGTLYVTRAKYSDKTTRLIPFIFSEIDSYQIEVGDQYMRFFQGREPLTETAQNITAITKANPCVVTYNGGDNYSNGDEIYIKDIVGMTELNNRSFKVANVNTGANTFELQTLDSTNVNSTNYTTYVSGGSVGVVYEIVSPYLETDVENIKYAQLGDIMYLVDGRQRPQKLSRTSINTFTIANMDNQRGPVRDVNITATTMTASGTMTSGAAITMTASTSTFVASDVGSVWGFRAAAGTGEIAYARMTAYTSGTSADFTVQTVDTSGGITVTSSTKWYAPAWSDTRGYPRAVAFHESRIAFAGVAEDPLNIYLSSNAQRYETFDRVINQPTDGDAIIATISGRLNTIQWLVSDGDFLVAGTYGGLAFLGSGSQTQALTPTNAKANNGTSFGSSAIQGLKFNNTVKYIEKSRTQLYQAQYDDVSLNYIGNDISVFNPDILEPLVKYMDFQETSYPILWMVRDDGILVGLTQNLNEKVNGFHDHDTGRLFLNTGVTTGDSFLNVSVSPGEKYDEAWFIVRRNVNGNTYQYIEYMEPEPRATNEPRYLDCSVKQTTLAATAVVTRLEHLEDEQVWAYVDNSFAGIHTVTGGKITANATGTTIYVGRPYYMDLEPMLRSAGSENGSAQGKKKRVYELLVTVYQTRALKAGRTFDNLDTIPFRSTADDMDTAIPLAGATYPEVLELSFNGTWSSDARICLRSDTPTPCTITAIHARMETNDK